MVHKESIGRVLGENGKTYIPSVNDNENGSFSFSFTDGENTINGEDIKIPFVIPTPTDDKGLEFYVGTIDDIETNGLPTFSHDDLKGDTGTSAIDIKAIDLNNYNLDELSLDTIYIDVQDDTDENDNIDTQVNAYIVHENEGTRKLEQINSVIDFSNFYTKSEIDTQEANIIQYINNQINDVADSQQRIIQILNTGLTMTDEDYTTNNNVVNVMSEASIEDVKNQIYEELKEYVKENDIQFDNETGMINIKY